MSISRKKRGREKEAVYLFKILDYLTSLDNDCIILVEGKNDAEALRKIGVKVRIVQATKESLEEIVNGHFKQGRVILMPDFDERGKKNLREWARLVSGVKRVDEITWKKLSKILKREAKDVESLPKIVERMKNYLER